VTTLRTYTFRPSHQIGTWVCRLIVASVALNVLDSLVFYPHSGSGRYVIQIRPGARPSSQGLSSVPQPLALIAAVLSLGLIVAWLVWQHRVTENVWARGIHIDTTPGWAVGWWFVPVAGLWMPAVALSRVYRAAVREEGHPTRAWIVLAWWLSYIVPSLVVVTLLARLMFHQIGDAIEAANAGSGTTLDLTPWIRQAAPWRLVLTLSSVLAGALAVTIVRRIDRASQAVGSAASVPPRPDLG
jgi:hypothetical protein